MKFSSPTQQRSETPKVVSRSDAQQLTDQLTGTWYLPGDDGYEDAKKAWALSVEHEPAIIVAVQNPADVVAAVNFANAHNLLIAVQSTGHGAAAPCTGQLLIVTSAMNQFSIDVAAQTLTTEAGAAWDAIINEAQRSGLAPLTGFVNNVGVTGYTLGGGFGWLVRKYGLAVDYLLSVNLVKLTGETVTASATEHPDLFWGLCGGVGNFGVVTSLTMKLVPVKEVVASQFYFPADQAPRVLDVYRTTAGSLPEEMTSTGSIMHLPPVPALPSAIRGQFVIAVKAVFLGDKAQAKQLLSPFHELNPIYETHEVMSYQGAGKIGGEPEKPQKSCGHVELLDEFPPDLVGILSNIAAGVGSVKPIIEIRHVAGAMARVSADKNAFGHRDAQFIVHAEIPLTEDVTPEAATGYVQQLLEAMKPYVTGGTYLNFIGNTETDEAFVKAAFSADHYARLRRIKHQYDPGSSLRFTFNIPPANS